MAKQNAGKTAEEVADQNGNDEEEGNQHEA